MGQTLLIYGGICADIIMCIWKSIPLIFFVLRHTHTCEARVSAIAGARLAYAGWKKHVFVNLPGIYS